MTKAKTTTTIHRVLEGVRAVKPSRTRAQFEERFEEAEATAKRLAKTEPGPRIRLGRPRKAEPPVPTVMLSVRIPETLKNDLAAMAASHGWTVAEEARRAFDQATALHGRPKPSGAAGSNGKRRAE